MNRPHPLEDLLGVGVGHRAVVVEVDAERVDPVATRLDATCAATTAGRCTESR